MGSNTLLATFSIVSHRTNSPGVSSQESSLYSAYKFKLVDVAAGVKQCDHKHSSYNYLDSYKVINPLPLPEIENSPTDFCLFFVFASRTKPRRRGRGGGRGGGGSRSGGYGRDRGHSSRDYGYDYYYDYPPPRRLPPPGYDYDRRSVLKIMGCLACIMVIQQHYFFNFYKVFFNDICRSRGLHCNFYLGSFSYDQLLCSL